MTKNAYPNQPSWLAVGVIYLAVIAAFIAMYLPQPILPLLARVFVINASQAGLLISIMVLGIAVSGLLIAPLSDRVGRKPILLGSTVLLALASCACAFAPSYAWLLLARFCQGALIPGILTVSLAYLSEEFQQEQVPRLIGGYIAATVTGGLLSRILSGTLTQAFGWRYVFVSSALLSLCVSIAILVFVPSSRNFVARARFSDAFRGMFRHLKNRQLVGIFLLGMMIFFAFLGLFTYLPFYLEAPPFSFSALSIGFIYVVYAAGIVSAPFAGFLSNRFAAWLVLIVGLGLTIIANTLTFTNSAALLIGALFFLCFANFIVQSTATSMIALLAKQDRAGANALYLFMYYAGGSLGGFLPGLGWAQSEWLGVLSWTLVALVLGILSIFILVRPKRAYSPSNSPKNLSSIVNLCPSEEDASQ